MYIFLHTYICTYSIMYSIINTKFKVWIAINLASYVWQISKGILSCLQKFFEQLLTLVNKNLIHQHRFIKFIKLWSHRTFIVCINSVTHALFCKIIHSYVAR